MPAAPVTQVVLGGQIRPADDVTTATLLENPASATRAAFGQAVADEATTPASPLATALNSTFERRYNIIESVPFRVFGNSYGGGSQGADQASRPFNRIANRFRTATPTISAVAGTRMDQIATAIAAGWTPNTRGLVGFSDGAINDVIQFATDAARVTTREAFRTCLAYLTARAVNGLTSVAFGFDASWSAGGVSSTADSRFNFAHSSATAYLLVQFTTATGGVLNVYNSSDVLVATVNTGGYAATFTGAIKVTGTEGVTSQMYAVLASGTATVIGLAVASPTPPVILWDKPSRFSNDNTRATRLALYLAECATILTDFPTVVECDMLAGWDYLTMISDGTHRNDLGNRFAADSIEAALRDAVETEQQGLNWLSISTSGAAAAYTTPAAPALAPITTYAADTFTRSGAVGTAETGGQTWTQNNGSTSWSCNGTQLASTAVAVNANDCYVDTAQADGTVQATRAYTLGGQSIGIVFRASGANNVNGYIFWTSGLTYTLSKRTGLNSYTSLGTGGGAAQPGDVMTVVMNGSSIVCKVNGVTVISVTDASYTGTRHGLWANANQVALFDDFSHTDSVRA